MTAKESKLVEDFRQYLFQRYRTAKNLGKSDLESELLDVYKKFNEMFKSK